MDSKIHYEEDLFFLGVLVKGLREGLRLTLDADLFAERVFDDVRFIGGTLDAIFSHLRENTRLIRRADYFHQLVKIQGSFGELVQELIDHEAWAEWLSLHKTELLRWKNEHQDDVDDIRQLMKTAGQEPDREEVITADELTLLTQPDPAEENSPAR